MPKAKLQFFEWKFKRFSQKRFESLDIWSVMYTMGRFREITTMRFSPVPSFFFLLFFTKLFLYNKQWCSKYGGAKLHSVESGFLVTFWFFMAVILICSCFVYYKLAFLFCFTYTQSIPFVHTSLCQHITITIRRTWKKCYLSLCCRKIQWLELDGSKW